MKSFSQKTKESLCKIPPGKLCCVQAEMMAILIFAGRFKGSEIKVVSESREVMKRFAVLVKRHCGEATLVEEGKRKSGSKEAEAVPIDNLMKKKR